MSLSKERIEEFREIFKKEYGKELSWEEAEESAQGLFNLAELTFDIAIKEMRRKNKLKDNPKGFHLTDGTYTCAICGIQIMGDSSWYDKFGVKCMTCQRAVEKRIIPGSLCENKDSWYSVWELEHYYSLKSPTVRKLVREGKLKARVVPTEDGKPYCSIFLIRDNPGVLKPKLKAICKQEENGYISVEQPKMTLGDGIK
jgi:hypothetical protein